jgi:hypothetical protein
MKIFRGCHSSLFRCSDVCGTAGSSDVYQRVQPVHAKLPGIAVMLPGPASADRFRACLARLGTPGSRLRLLLLRCFCRTAVGEPISSVRRYQSPVVGFCDELRLFFDVGIGEKCPAGWEMKGSFRSGIGNE